MTREKETLWCDGCVVEILWAPLTLDSQVFCCQACLEGCACDWASEWRWMSAAQLSRVE